MTSTARLASMSLLAALAGCAALETAPPVPLDTDFQPATACAAQVKVPQIVSTSAVDFAEPIWQHQGPWEVQLHFRIDEAGVPRTVRATTSGTEDNDTFARVAATALERYRFCQPVEYSTQTDWAARLRFSTSVIADGAGGGRMIIQLFLPAYTREDLSAGRRGTNRIVGTFGQDGRPTRLRLSLSSGDPVLDRKSLEAMASWQLVYRPGTVLRRPVTYEQPYIYEIR